MFMTLMRSQVQGQVTQRPPHVPSEIFIDLILYRIRTRLSLTLIASIASLLSDILLFSKYFFSQFISSYSRQNRLFVNYGEELN